MKKISTLLLTAATIVAAVASCNKNNPVAEPASSEPAKGLLSITIGMDEASTKAAFNDMKDAQINKVQVFVFDAANLLETSYYADLTGVSGATNVEIATFTGNKTVYAVLNHPRITSMKPKVSTLANFEAILSDLADNTPTNLIMSGKNVVNVSEYGANGSLATAAPTALQIYVKRLAAAVILKKVTVDFAVGDLVRVQTGPFSGMEGKVSSMNDQTQVANVLIMLFGRETPTDINYNDLQKVEDE